MCVLNTKKEEGSRGEKEKRDGKQNRNNRNRKNFCNFFHTYLSQDITVMNKFKTLNQSTVLCIKHKDSFSLESWEAVYHLLHISKHPLCEGWPCDWILSNSIWPKVCISLSAFFITIFLHGLPSFSWATEVMIAVIATLDTQGWWEENHQNLFLTAWSNLFQITNPLPWTTLTWEFARLLCKGQVISLLLASYILYHLFQ